MFKFFKKITIIFVFIYFIMLNTNAYNSSWTDLELDSNTWCKGIDINFKVYNKTQFLNKKEILADLCNENETSEEDNCKEFDKIKGNVKIYDGPFDSSKLLYDKNLNSNDEFTFKFNKSNFYLIKIKPEGNYNDFEKPFEVRYCKWLNNDNNNDNNKNKNNSKNNELKKNNSKKLLFNKSYTYSDIKLNIYNTNINAYSLKITKINDFKSNNLSFINNSIKILNIELLNNSLNYSNMNIEINENFKNISNIELFKYNISNKKWIKISKSSYNISNESLILDKANFGIYSITGINNSINKIKKKESNKTDLNSKNTNSNYNKNLNSKNSKNNNLLIIFILVMIGLLVIILLHKFGNGVKKENKDNKEILNSYTDIYSRSKDYVRKYKENYSKDKIYRGLKIANVPEDIIEKIFLEEY